MGLLAAGGCGGSDETAGGGSAATAKPHGVLRADGIGPVRQGDSRADIEQAFGEPEEATQVSGCELAPDAARYLQLRYPLEGGHLMINLDRADALASYRAQSPAFETGRGDRVGDPLTSVKRRWQEELAPLDLGAPATPAAGNWVVGRGPRSSLLFGVAKGHVQHISGGYLRPCE